MSVFEKLRPQESAPAMNAAPPASNGEHFRLAMREFASGVCLVTSPGAERAGCTATAVSSLSLTPPALIVCLDRANSTFLRLRDMGVFAVNVLAAEHEALAARFAGRDGAKGEARFQLGDWMQLVTGAPVLADALAAIECRVEEILDRNTHAIVIGAVEAVRLGETRPALAHWRSRFEPLG